MAFLHVAEGESEMALTSPAGVAAGAFAAFAARVIWTQIHVRKQ
jgi:hypothetical protein